jgi:hypothetical protein
MLINTNIEFMGYNMYRTVRIGHFLGTAELAEFSLMFNYNCWDIFPFPMFSKSKVILREVSRAQNGKG